MLKLINKGDLVRIPQNVCLYKALNSEADSLTGAWTMLKQQGYAIFNQTVGYNMAEIYYQGETWLVNIEDIFEGE